MTPNQRRDFAKIVQFGLLWGIGGILYSLIEYGILGDSEIYPSTKNLYDFKTSIISASLSSLLTGLIIGTIETKLVSSYFQVRNFWQKIVFKTALYDIIPIGECQLKGRHEKIELFTIQD